MTSRICPQCRTRTDAMVCALDGFPTVDASRYVDDDAERLVGRDFDGRYRIEACIGRGGMGAVYRANQLSVGRAVALKILKPEYARNLDQVKRFQNEARAASKLEHPHTIRVYDFGQADDGALYLVTELLEGEPLSERLLREHHLPPATVVAISAQVLKSLSEAHARGIVHRDMKPENVFLKHMHGEDDFVKVLDFGIAKVADSDQRRITTTGTVVGTPLYMSPEQARGRSVEKTTDIYSLGAVMWEMLTGSPPFGGETAMAVMMAHVQQPLPPLGVDTPGAAELGRLIAWCMSKDASERPQSADELRRALAEWDSTFNAGARALLSSASMPAMSASRASNPTPAAAPVLALPEVSEDGYDPDELTLEAFGTVRGPRWGRWFVLLLLIAGGAVAWFGYRDRWYPSQDLSSGVPGAAETAPAPAEPRQGAAPSRPDMPRSELEPAPPERAADEAPTPRRAADQPSPLPRAEVAPEPAEPHSERVKPETVRPRRPRSAPAPELRVEKK